MAVKLRMKRLGNRHRPFYRIVSVDERKKRDGRVIEELGTYNPLERDETRQVAVKLDRAVYWLSVGAQPSDTVATLLKRHGLTTKPGTRPEDQPADLEAAAAEALSQVKARQGERLKTRAAQEAKRKAEEEAKLKAELEAKQKEEAQAKAAEEAAKAEAEASEDKAEGEDAAAEGDAAAPAAEENKE